VFEVSSPARDLAAAAARIGLEVIAEEALDVDPDDEDGSALYYLMIPDRIALEQMERLWRLWEAERPLGRKNDAFAGLFSCLRAVRRWSAQDRVADDDAEALRQLALEEPDAMINVEVELVFRADEVHAAAAEREILAAVAAVGGKQLDRGRHPSFASHALLVRLPADRVLDLAERRVGSLADLEPIRAIGPQAMLDVDHSPEPAGAAPPIDDPVPEGVPIAAIFDAVPIQRHPLLQGRVEIDDPDDLETLSVGRRLHGTAMASLVLHGDLNEDGAPIDRPLLLRPIMYAPTVGEADETFPPDKLVVDRFYDAVVRMRRGGPGVPAAGPGVIVVNVSVGDRRRRFGKSLSRWARAIDDLAWRHGILFLVSAGNLDLEGLDDVPIAGFADMAAFRAATDGERSRAILEGLRDHMRNRSLLAPADSVNALTVGAAHRDAIGAPDRRAAASFDPYATLDLPNLSSAPGPGFGRAVKPEILLPGGRERVVPVLGPDGLCVRARPASGAAGLKVAAPDPSGAGTSYTGQTSAAAAIATRTAHRIHDALEAAYGDVFAGMPGTYRALVLKALLAHRARWPASARTIVDVFGPPEGWQKQRANVGRLLGLGVVDPDEAVSCAANRATAWGVGSLTADAGAVFRMPLPIALSGRVVPHSITATLAWFTPTRPGRQSYKQIRLKLIDPAAEVLGRLALATGKGQPDGHAVHRGTVVQRKFEGGQAAALLTGEALQLKVQREPDEGLAGEAIPFAVAMTVEADADLPIYTQVRSMLAVKPRVAIRT